MAIEELAKGGTDGSRALGLQDKVTASPGVTTQLTTADSGGVFLLDRATMEYLLPAVPVAGTKYKFMNTISADGASQKITASVTSGAIFLLGSLEYAVDTAATGECHLANGTSHVQVDIVSDETGGIIGGSFEVTALNATQWNITGTLNASGTMTTPFTT